MNSFVNWCIFLVVFSIWVVNITSGTEVRLYYFKFANASRFEEPSKLEFTGESLRDFPPACYQAESFQSSENMSEDCLFLNLWVPSIPSNETLPVVVWIHGGGFEYGSSMTYNGSLLATEGKVIVAAPQYRLGILGFFGFEGFRTSNGVGNLGLLDQLAALEWIKENIAHFGGDPNKITIMGESAGGTSVLMLQTIVNDTSLFQGVISMSGVFNPPLEKSLEQSYMDAENLIKRAGCNSTDEMQVKDCLLNMNVKDLIEATQSPAGEFIFVPTVDHVLLPDLLNNSFAEGNFLNIPTVIGLTESEWGAVYCISFNYTMNYDTLLRALNFAYNENLTEKIIDFYNISMEENRNYIQDFIQINVHFQVACPTRRIVKKIGSHQANTFFYTFGKRLETLPECFGASHSLELPFIFPKSHSEPLHTNQTFSTSEWRISQEIINYLSNFATTGNVNDPSSTRTLTVELPRWEAYDEDTGSDFYFGDPSSSRSEYYEVVCNFWDEIEFKPKSLFVLENIPTLTEFYEIR